MELDLFYPIGTFYETSDSAFNPNIEWGGSWRNDDESCILISDPNGQNSTNISGYTGSDIVTLTIAEMPSHEHTVSLKTITNDGNTTQSTCTYGDTKRTSYVTAFYNNPSGPNSWGYGTTTWQSTGGSSAHNNMQPYITTIRWRRYA